MLDFRTVPCSLALVGLLLLLATPFPAPGQTTQCKNPQKPSRAQCWDCHWGEGSQSESYTCTCGPDPVTTSTFSMSDCPSCTLGVDQNNELVCEINVTVTCQDSPNKTPTPPFCDCSTQCLEHGIKLTTVIAGQQVAAEFLEVRSGKHRVTYQPAPGLKSDLRIVLSTPTSANGETLPTIFDRDLGGSVVFDDNRLEPLGSLECFCYAVNCLDSQGHIVASCDPTIANRSTSTDPGPLIDPLGSRAPVTREDSP